MKFWLPYVVGGSGADVSITYLAKALRTAGHEAECHAAPHALQFMPWLLRAIRPPKGTDVIISSSWSGFAFHRPPIRHLTVERLFTLDRSLIPHRSLAQNVFHHTLVRHFVTRSYRTADAVVAMSQATHRQIARAFPDLAPVLIPNAVDIEFFTPGPQPKRPPEGRPVRLLFVGNLTRRKGADLLVPLLQALGPGYELSYTSGLRTNDPLGEMPGLTCLGRLSQEEVREAYRAADILVLPSRMEGFPRAVMEAQACGTPAVVSDASSLPETVEDGRTGWVCRSGDAPDFAAAIRRTVEEPGRLAAMSAAARAWAEARYDLRQMVAAYVALAASLAPVEADPAAYARPVAK